MTICWQDIYVGLKHRVDILMASNETDSRLTSALLLVESKSCIRSLVVILSSICESSSGFIGPLPYRLNSHFA